MGPSARGGAAERSHGDPRTADCTTPRESRYGHVPLRPTYGTGITIYGLRSRLVSLLPHMSGIINVMARCSDMQLTGVVVWSGVYTGLLASMHAVYDRKYTARVETELGH